MRKLIITLFFFFFILNSFGQQTDILENIYTIENNILTKKNLKTNEIYSYKNDALGDITSIDVSNPFQILIFYKQFNTCEIISEKFAKKQTINFDNFDIKSDAICNSSSNGIWIYDDIQQYLINFDLNLQEINFKKHFVAYASVILIFEQENYIVLTTTNKIYILNNLCKIKNSYDVNYKKHTINKNNIMIEDLEGKTYLQKNGKLEKTNN
ncbi:MAG: hypothetical protein JXL97_07280 [Bacteroidales bacterium]|nr:hypothetical protein [Bacteroidales bacterium]